MGSTLSIETAQFIDRKRKSKQSIISPPQPNTILDHDEAPEPTNDNLVIDSTNQDTKKRVFQKTQYNNVSTTDPE